jgi:MFS family permease
VQATPLLGVSLLGGLLADRFPRRAILLTTQLALAGLSAGMGLLALTGQLTPARLLLLAGLLIAVEDPDQPTRP